MAERKGEAPTFLVGAMKDPLSGHLDRIQIIKGWLDADGVTQEKVFNVVWGDAHERELQPDGKLPAIGNTVNVADASWTNAIGDAELVGFWRDPEFDATQACGVLRARDRDSDATLGCLRRQALR